MVTTFTIDRATWAEAQRINRMARSGLYALFSNRLLDKKDGTRCCLGFYLSACGVDDAALEDKDLPSSVAELPEEAKWLVRSRALGPYGDAAEEALSSVNDGRGKNGELRDQMMPAEREHFIKGFFKAHGIVVNFVGSYPGRAR